MCNVLVVDDERSFIEDIKAMLPGDGYEVKSNDSFEAALSRFNTDRLDWAVEVCLVDFNLKSDPRQNGAKLIQTLRHHSVDIPMILLTSADDHHIAFTAGESGATSYCRKDELVTTEKLVQIIDHAIEKNREDREVGMSKMAALDRGLIYLLGEFWHDTKNIFVPIQASTNAVEQSIDALSKRTAGLGLNGQEMLHHLSQIKRKCEEGTRWLEDLKEFVQTGKITLQESNVTISNLVRSSQNEFHQAGNLNYESLVVEAKIDEKAIKRVLKSIFNNVRDHVGSDAAVLCKVDSIRRSDIDILRISVRDYGQGIPDDDKKRIFYPGVVTDPEGRNMGLGLCIAKKYLEAHQVHDQRGKIFCVDPEEGVGTCFILEVPTTFMTMQKLSNT